MADALARGEQAVGELLRLEMRVAGNVLEPLHAVARGALQLERFEVALRPVALETGADVLGGGHLRDQRHRIFHGELRARADAEVRGVRRIADEDEIAVVPALAQHAVEIEPRRAAQVARVAHQPLAAQVLAEQLLAKLDRLLRGVAIEAVRLPGLLARFDDDGRQIGAELIGVNLKPAVLGVLEGEGEGGKLLFRAEPDEAAFAHVDVRLEGIGVSAALNAVDAVGRNDQIGVREFGLRVDLVLKELLHAQARRRAPERC